MNVAGNFFATLDEKLSGLEAENARLNAELTSVYGSKRWRYLSKVLDRLPRSGWKSRDEVPKVVPEAGKPREKHGFPVATGEADAVPEEPASRNFHQDRIDIINMKFFDFDGKTFMNGGAERYVYDLACLLKKNGKKPRILQVAHRPFTKTYRGIKVVGVAVKHTDWWHFDEASHAFNNACAGSELIIASPVELASEITVCPVIGINHGMSLDSPFDFAACPARDLLARYHTVFRALDRATITVCVDTNFPNWVQTFDYELRQKLRFIPNYYDEKAFRPTTKRFDKGLKFVFPRRVADYRGADITLTAFSDLLAAYPEISLAIIGQYHSKENEAAVKI